MHLREDIQYALKDALESNYIKLLSDLQRHKTLGCYLEIRTEKYKLQF